MTNMYNPQNPYAQQLQDKLNQLQNNVAPQVQQQQQQIRITPEMQQVALQKQEGQDALSRFNKAKQTIIDGLILNTREGGIAFAKYEDEIIAIFNNVLLETVKNQNENNVKNDDAEKLRKQNAELLAEIDKMKQLQKVATEQPPTKGGK